MVSQGLDFEALMNSSQGGEKDFYYLLVERNEQSYRDIYTYQNGESEELAKEPLYLLTEYHAHLGQSPFVVEVEANSPLMKRFQQNCLEQQGWQGVLFHSKLAFSPFCTFLRSRLTLKFEGVRKGLLRFEDPKVVSYFFGQAPQSDFDLWAGPILSAIWFEHMPWLAQGQWKQIQNLSLAFDAGDSLWTMTQGQEQALEKKYDDALILQHLKHYPAEVNEEWWLRRRDEIAAAEKKGITQPEMILEHLAHAREQDQRIKEAV